MKVNGKDYSIYDMENKECLKPPTSYDKDIPKTELMLPGLVMTNTSP